MSFDTVIASTTPDQLMVTGVTDIITKGETILTGQGVVARGTVMGLITASGKLAVCDVASTDGSEVPYGVLTSTVDTTAADVEGTVYLTGSFNDDPAVLIFGGATVVTNVWDAMRIRGMFALSATQTV